MSANNTSGAFHHVFRSLAAGQQQQPGEPSTAGAEAAPDLILNDAVQASETTGQIPLNNAQMDVDVPPVVDGGNYDSDDSMPALRDVDDSDDSDDDFSASDSEMDADELEVQLQTVRDQQDSQNADVAGPSSVTSGISSPSRNNRRSRGQLDGDEDRDRRHPSQRTGSESTGGSTPRRIFAHNNATPHPAPAQAPPPPNVNPQPTHNAQAPRTQNLMRLLGFTIDLPTGHVHPLPPTGLAAGAFPPPGAFPLNFNGDVGDLFARLGMAGGLVPEQEDPERAKQLVDGLEEVPIGLVRRLERVGNIAGTDASGTGGDCGCAICWDKLLDGDGNQFADGQDSSSSQSMAVDPAATASGVDSPDPNSSEQPHPKIVALPCSHVSTRPVSFPGSRDHGRPLAQPAVSTLIQRILPIDAADALLRLLIPQIRL
ncbi:hypothetical protein CPB85DRAFT_366535 [Mucidula mucida]|nr:hypothetical protein CPB85DRAFT_366535 [Mucidula mucida]